MAAPVPLRTEFDAAQLRGLARLAVDLGQVRRVPALAAIYAGEPRSAAAALGGVGLQTVRDWVVRSNADGPAGLETGRAPGKLSLLDAHQRAALFQVVEAGPSPAIHGVVRWRIVDLIHWVWEEFRLSLSKQTMSKELRALGLRKLSARPRHITPKTRTSPLVLPRYTTAAMALHLIEIPNTVAPGAHAVLLLDQAGWHMTGKLSVPTNITLLPLPEKSPEPNPVENIWQFMRRPKATPAGR